MNLDSNCNNLDAYLSDDLSAECRAIFESHLESCATCRDALDQQQWIDDLLRSPERLEIEQPSATVLDPVRSTIVRRERQTLRTAYTLAAAAVLLIGIGWIVLDRQTAQPHTPATQEVVATKAHFSPTATTPEATFVASTDAIVVPMESSSTDVTVVQVYPTTDTERRWRLEQSLSTLSTQPNGG